MCDGVVNNTPSHSQNKQNDFRIIVLVKIFRVSRASPIAPNKNPNNIRAKYGNADNTPAFDKLNLSTSLIYFGAAESRKNKPHALP